MSISQQDFAHACHSFESYCGGSASLSPWVDVLIVEDYGTTYLRITTKLPRNEQHKDAPTQEQRETEITEHDEESLIPSRKGKEQPLVIYDIIHSPTYQVPVLYLTFKHLQPLPSLDEVYDLLVSSQHRPSMQTVGVVGALSVTDHPFSNTPAYFVHPCRTAETMRGMIDGEAAKLEEYLMRWLGIVGAGVGLFVPVSVAERIRKSVSLEDSYGGQSQD